MTPDQTDDDWVRPSYRGGVNEGCIATILWCERCGAVVHDDLAHDAWHRLIDPREETR